MPGGVLHSGLLSLSKGSELARWDLSVTPYLGMNWYHFAYYRFAYSHFTYLLLLSAISSTHAKCQEKCLDLLGNIINTVQKYIHVYIIYRIPVF